MLRCHVRIVQMRKPGVGLQSEYHVVRVLEHLPRQPQLSLENGELPRNIGPGEPRGEIGPGDEPARNGG
jgi:hypothetical protein